MVTSQYSQSLVNALGRMADHYEETTGQEPRWYFDEYFVWASAHIERFNGRVVVSCPPGWIRNKYTVEFDSAANAANFILIW